MQKTSDNDWTLERLLSWPFGPYPIDDYIDQVLEAIHTCRLLEAIRATQPDDGLISEYIWFYYNLSFGVTCGVLFRDSDFDSDAECRDILVCLVDHLQNRELELHDLEYLSVILFNVFGLHPFHKELQKYIDGDNDLGTWEKDFDLLLIGKILSVFEFKKNRQKIQNALETNLAEGFYDAVDIATYIDGKNEFELRFNAMKNGEPARYVTKLVESAKNIEQINLIVEWVIKYFHIQENGYSQITRPGMDDVLEAIVKKLKNYSGVGRPIILASLISHSIARKYAAETLLEWEIGDWPENILERLKNALYHTEGTANRLLEAQEKFEAKISTTK